MLLYVGYPPSPNPLQPPEMDEPKLVDKSEALFTMYLERADDDDNKITEKWKKECEVILIFVCTVAIYFRIQPPCLCFGRRPVFFQPLSRPFLQFLSWTFGRVHKIPQPLMSQISIIYSPTPLRPNPSFSPDLSIHLSFLHQNMRSWSTRSGS